MKMDVELQNSVVKTEIIQEAIPEIVMVGSQTPFASLVIPGKDCIPICRKCLGDGWYDG